MNDTRSKLKILCVDDESRVVEGLALNLQKDYEVHTALGGEEGLQKLKALGGVAVVISDMRMPGMNGAIFLKRVMRAYPETTRVLLTGEGGRDVAALAVNEGQIFRFLTKPCPPDQLRIALEAAIIQHRLVTAERLLMQETVVGCIQALIDVLAMTNPVAFGRASRIKRQVMQLADSLECRGFWQLEAASMLSHLGYLSLPADLVEKLYNGVSLTREEQVLADGVPRVTTNLLEHIPRLEPVLQILNAVSASDEQLGKLGEGTIGLGARMLALTLQYDALIAKGLNTDIAVQTLRDQLPRYGATLVDKFASLVGAEGGSEILEIPLRMVKPGMTIMEDLRSHSGTLLVPRGFEVSETFLQRLHNLGASTLSENVKVIVNRSRRQAVGVA